MANDLKTSLPTGSALFRFRDSTDFAPATANILTVGTPTDVQVQFASIANNAARQSAKADIGVGSDLIPVEMVVVAALEFATGVIAGEIGEFWWAPSVVSAAANGNPGGVSGSDSAYTGYSSNLDDSLPQLQWIGAFIVTDDDTGTVQIAVVSEGFAPMLRHGTLVFVNRSAIAMHSDDVEMSVVFYERTPQLQ